MALPKLVEPRSNGDDTFHERGLLPRAASTEAQYEVRDRQLRNRFARETGITASDDPEAFVIWLVGLMRTLEPASRRHYRAAVRLGLNLLRKVATTADASARAAAALRHLDASAATAQPMLPPRAMPAEHDGAPRPPATSARKLKRLTDTILAALDAALSAQHGASDAALRAYLRAGYLTGLRPSEWRHVRFVVGLHRAVLVVRNAKSTHGRAHGRYRRLVWADPAAPEVVAVAHWLSMLREHTNFDAFIQSLRDRIRLVGRRLWPKRRRRPTLYSTRHGFAAMAKCVFDTVEVAAVMGHAHDATATAHYARPPRGGGGRLPTCDLPRPHPRDVARVRAVYAERRAFIDMRMQADHARRP